MIPKDEPKAADPSPPEYALVIETAGNGPRGKFWWAQFRASSWLRFLQGYYKRPEPGCVSGYDWFDSEDQAIADYVRVRGCRPHHVYHQNFDGRYHAYKWDEKHFPTAAEKEWESAKNWDWPPNDKRWELSDAAKNRIWTEASKEFNDKKSLVDKHGMCKVLDSAFACSRLSELNTAELYEEAVVQSLLARDGAPSYLIDYLRESSPDFDFQLDKNINTDVRFKRMIEHFHK